MNVITRQPVPKVTGADVERIVRRDFPADQVSEALALLEEYGKESWHRETHRVRVATLKLAAGSIERLRQEIEGAKRDYRDVLAYAEYPGYFRQVPASGKISADERRQVIDTDWKQYQHWFGR